MAQTDVKELQETAKRIRRLIVETLSYAKAGHTGGSLSATDILTVLYFHEMKVDPKNPRWEDRDRFVLSKGHSSCGLYCALAEKGYFDKEMLKEFDRIDGHLQGHPDMHKTPGVDMSTGSLGQGISVACGMALGAKKLKKDFRTFVLVGDGESQEGQVWEAAMFAGQNQLDNLTAIIDYNKLQLASCVKDCIDLEPLAKKFEAFNWSVQEIDGHNIPELVRAFENAKNTKGKPSMIIAHTIKAKGLSFAENKVEWHVRVPKGDEVAQAMKELE